MWWLAKKLAWKVVTVGLVTLTGIATRRIVEKSLQGSTPPTAGADGAGRPGPDALNQSGS
jgi:hypothetical protein